MVGVRHAEIVGLHHISKMHSINARHEVVDEFVFILMLLNLQTKVQVSGHINLRGEFVVLSGQLPLSHGLVKLVAEARGSDYRVEPF